MINFLKEQFIFWRLKNRLHKYTRPNGAFLRSSREKFVLMVKQRAPIGVKVKHSRSFRYATAAIVALLSMTSGMAVFADANNVPATHPLYNLKRISEEVRLGLSAPDQRAELHKKFAHRRLEEAADLESGKYDKLGIDENRDRINGLDNDFQHEAETALGRPKEDRHNPEDAKKFCDDILKRIQMMPKPGHPNNHMSDEIKDKCAELSQELPQSD